MSDSPRRRRQHATGDWNVVVSVKERGFTMARELLAEYGVVRKTSCYNVLVMKVASQVEILAKLEQRLQVDPDVLAYVARIAPATFAFDFATKEELEARAREAVAQLVPRLAGKTFHVRMHRRGLKGALLSPIEERFLDDTLLEALNSAGTPGFIRFDDPDAVIDVETIDHRAGIALWTREDLKRYPFLKPE